MGWARTRRGSSTGGGRSGVTLGHDVWIGHGAIVLPGVSIGSGAAVGAGAVVSRDLPPFAVAVGVPARVRALALRARDRCGVAAHRLVGLDRPRLAEALEDFRRLDAGTFCRKYDPA